MTHLDSYQTTKWPETFQFFWGLQKVVIYICICVHIYVYAHIHIYEYLCVYTYIWIYTNTCIWIHMKCTYEYINIHIWIYANTCIFFLKIYIYIFIYQGGSLTSAVHNLLVCFDSIPLLFIHKWEHSPDVENMNINTCFRRTFSQGLILLP